MKFMDLFAKQMPKQPTRELYEQNGQILQLFPAEATPTQTEEETNQEETVETDGAESYQRDPAEVKLTYHQELEIYYETERIIQNAINAQQQDKLNLILAKLPDANNPNWKSFIQLNGLFYCHAKHHITYANHISDTNQSCCLYLDLVLAHPIYDFTDGVPNKRDPKMCYNIYYYTDDKWFQLSTL